MLNAINKQIKIITLSKLKTLINKKFIYKN